MTVLSSGTATDFARSSLASAPGPAEVLGSFPTACYLRLAGGAVIAVLTSDAIQLPIGVTLPWPSEQFPLDRSAPAASVQDGGLRLGRLRITITGRRDAALAHCGRPLPSTVEAASASTDLDHTEVGAVDPFAFGPSVAAARLLGRGPGLTPAGDDLLCGALAAIVLFGLPDDGLATAVTERLAEPRATTSLSRQLLLRAIAGDGLPQLQAAGRAACRPDPATLRLALHELRRIGHSSGAALAAGLLAGARHARERVAA